MSENFNETMKFEPPKENSVEPKEVLFSVYASLKEKGYNPIDQIIGYLLSGDPTYITSHNNARSLIRKLERDELLEEILRAYLKCDKV
ncbi:IreB family regulatory phosphoprotein [Tissierella creatinini]|nr:IreB family regulatory phosphoprotein [Tissierella creatinini]TJX69053.1 IreB family regulatory phosphoprotein [Soehngenia saccharolytica]